jgi:hypothetical protein
VCLRSFGQIPSKSLPAAQPSEFMHAAQPIEPVPAAHQQIPASRQPSKFLRADPPSEFLRADRPNEFVTPRTSEFPRITASPANPCQQRSPARSAPAAKPSGIRTSGSLPAAQPSESLPAAEMSSAQRQPEPASSGASLPEPGPATQMFASGQPGIHKVYGRRGAGRRDAHGKEEPSDGLRAITSLLDPRVDPRVQKPVELVCPPPAAPSSRCLVDWRLCAANRRPAARQTIHRSRGAALKVPCRPWPSTSPSRPARLPGSHCGFALPMRLI